MGCLIRSKKKKTKQVIIIISIIKINKWKREKGKEKEIKKLLKIILEAIILMISWHDKTIKMRDNSKTEHVEKK